MKYSNRIYLCFAFAALVLQGCAATFKQKLDFNPAEPLRVAVLPFVSVDKSGKIIEQEGRLLLDNISLVSTKLEETPAQIIRRMTLNELAKTNLDLVATPLIDLDLPHHGFALPDGKIDIAKVYQTKPSELCGSFLNCDAVLYGRVLNWDRSYYGIQSVNTVGVDLQLISAKDGRALYSAQAEDSDSRGLTKGPTGWSSVALEPILGLDSQIIVDLARKVVQQMVGPLKVKERPVFLETSPPAIFAVSHDAPTGPLDRGRPVIVVMFASEKLEAAFSIGDAIERIPMIERSPGHYYGEYVPLPTDSFSSQTVKAFIKDQYGRSTEAEVTGRQLTLTGFAKDGRASLQK